MLSQGLTKMEISREFQVSHQVLSRFVKRYHDLVYPLSLTERKLDGKIPEVVKGQIIRIRELLIHGPTKKEIANKLSESDGNISRFISKYKDNIYPL